MSNRREFSQSIRGEITRRAMRNNRIHCEGCGMDLTGKAIEFDHIIAEAFFTDKAPKLTAKDGQLLGTCCHRGPDGKTAKDVKAIAKVKRVEAKFAGSRPKPKQQIKSAPFAKADKPPRKPMLPARQLYQTTNHNQGD